MLGLVMLGQVMLGLVMLGQVMLGQVMLGQMIKIIFAVERMRLDYSDSDVIQASLIYLKMTN